ncbi:hypothetical protein J2045_003372 [Peteryoungia aggregata LMG 23059]|uniref:Uncharacterized protein n=1 Tax=Peteryoungia aggregata LMG 23059 TaxID=1368425 RepID=A0ABU0GAD8_9HYPH|nr:hypothetical protein [Peteryoungia aggregata]MDQ0422324.1 hypothetical protein [Peteryoungia aggregata LMG 23059]
MAVVWITGPIGYQKSWRLLEDGRRIVDACRWEFVGMEDDGTFRRWSLRFSTETRAFTANSLAVKDWEKTKAKELGEIYRPAAVLRSMLPKGSTAKALEAMLGDAGVAEAIGISLTQR